MSVNDESESPSGAEIMGEGCPSAPLAARSTSRAGLRDPRRRTTRFGHSSFRWIPYAVSLLFHVGLLLVLLLIRAAGPLAAEERVVPTAELIAAPGGKIYPELEQPKLHFNEEPEPVLTASPQHEPSVNLLSEIATRSSTNTPVIGMGITSAGPLDEYGLKAGSLGAGPKSEFFGHGGSAYKVIYVVDRSGSMIDTFDGLKRELKRSIEKLSHLQSFHIIFFSGGTPTEKPPKRLVRAIEVRKKEAFGFLDATVPVSEGGTDPALAMRRAIEMQPDLIYLLSDGGFSADLLVKLRRWNEGKKTRIYTIGYVFELEPGLLRRIAEEHGGEYRFVSEDELR